MKYDVELCKTLEAAETFGLRSAVSHAMEAFTERNIALEEIAGATVAYIEPGSPFNQATGAGLNCTVTDVDLDRITAFYHSRGETARVEVSPVCDPELPRKLAQRGYVIEEYENALAADLTEIAGRRDSRVEVCEDVEEWALVSGRGFGDGAEPDEPMRFIGVLMATHPSVIPLVLRENGKAVATACLGIEFDGVAGFFATATAPEARGKGHQSALIADRIARAKELGKTVARVTTKIGTTSERNFRRFGFTPVFTRTMWALPPAP